MKNLFEQIAKLSESFEFQTLVHVNGGSIEFNIMPPEHLSRLNSDQKSCVYGLIASYLTSHSATTERSKISNEDIDGNILIDLNYDSDSGWKLLVKPSENIANLELKESIISKLVTEFDALEQSQIP